MKEFAGKWFKPDFDTVITWDDFLDFYKDVSSSVDRDEYFDLLLKNTWKL